MWHPFSARIQSASKASRRAHNRRAARPRLEALEGRVVLSAAFDSVLTISGDASWVIPTDIAVDASGNTYVTGRLDGSTDFDPAVDHPDRSDILTPRGTSDAYVVKYAPDNSLVWARRMGSDNLQQSGDKLEMGNAVRVDGSGNVYVTGTFFEQADFGGFRLTSAGNADAFVTKLDRNGNILWAKGWGSADQDVGNDIAVDAAGNVVAVGTSAYADPVRTWIENTSQVRKYSSTGAAIWNQTYAGPTCGANGVATDPSGNIYVCGRFSGTIDFNSAKGKVNSVTGNYGSAYVLKLTSAGAYGWVSSFQTRPTASPNGSGMTLTDIAVDAAGNVIVGGQYQGQVDLDPSSAVDYRLPEARMINGFVAKLSSTGTLAWAKTTGGDYVNSVAVDASGAVYAAGYFGVSAAGYFNASDFNPGSGLPPVASNGSADACVTKFTASGNLDWALTFGGTGYDYCSGLTVDAAGTIYLTGAVGSVTTDYDPDPLTTQERTNALYYDMFLLKLKQK